MVEVIFPNYNASRSYRRPLSSYNRLVLDTGKTSSPTNYIQNPIRSYSNPNTIGGSVLHTTTTITTPTTTHARKARGSQQIGQSPFDWTVGAQAPRSLEQDPIKTYDTLAAAAATSPTPGFGYSSSGTYPAPTQLPTLSVSGSGSGGAGVTASGSADVTPGAANPAFPSLSSITTWITAHPLYAVVIIGAIIAAVVLGTYII